MFHLAVGDTVRLDFASLYRDPSVIEHALLLEVRTQYGSGVKHPYIAYRNLGTGEESGCSGSWVAGIVRRSTTRHRSRNIFAETPARFRTPYQPRRGQWESDLSHLVTAVLATLPNVPQRVIVADRLQDLFDKQTPGLIARPHAGWPAYIRVNAKPFRKWVVRNVTRILATTAEMDRQQDEEDAAWHEQWKRDMQDDLDRWIDEEPLPFLVPSTFRDADEPLQPWELELLGRSPDTLA